MENKNLTCSFFVHRKIEMSDEEIENLSNIIEDLIVNQGVRTFSFGSRSQFDSLCHQIVTDLKEIYPKIKRIGYTCKSESCILESERENWERIYSYFEKEKVHLLGVEEERIFKNKYTAGKASYIERNQEMVDASDICIIYYKEDYQPDRRKRYKRDFGTYQPRSGTALIFNYIKQKKSHLSTSYIIKNTRIEMEKFPFQQNKITKIKKFA